MANSFVRYTGNGTTTTYAIPFSYRSTEDLSATVAGVNVTAYTLDAAGTNLTFTTAPANGAAIEIRRTTSQTTKLVDYVSGSVLTENDLDTDSDQAFYMSQEAIDKANDVITLDNADFQWDTQNKRLKNVADPTSAQDAATKNYLENTWLSPANKLALTTVNANIANINAVNANEANINDVNSNEANINTVATNIGSVNTVATDIAKVITVANDLAEAVSEVETVADDLNEATSEIDTVANNITNVNTVGTNIANVNTVAGISANVTSVAGNNANITTVAGISSNVTTVANNNANITTVANDLNEPVSEIDTVATNIANVNTVGTNIANVNTVGGISGNVTTVAGISGNVTSVAGNATNINTVAGNNANITTVAGISGNVTTVAGISADVTAVAGDATDIGTVASNLTGTNTIGTVAGSIANVNNVGGSIANVNTVAGNLSGVNYFGERYRVSSSAPSTSLDVGDLYYDTTLDTMRVYGSSGWQNAGSSVNGTSERFNYTATGGQTTFTGSDNNGNTLAYDAGFIDVFLNGSKLLNGTDVTVTSGTSVVLASGATAGDVIDIVTYGTFSVATLDASNLTSGTVPDARITGAYTGITNLTMSGDLTVDTNTLYVDSTNNRVGIGTASPTSPLMVQSNETYPIHAKGSGAKAILLETTGGETEISTLQLKNSAYTYNIENGRRANTLTFYSNTGGERMCIDSSGNLLVGKTSTTYSDDGLQLNPEGLIGASDTNSISAIFNRNGTDGDIVNFRKDGTTIGVIGTISSGLVIGSSSTGIFFDNNQNSVKPRNSNGGVRDNAIDLGTNTNRWKDLYLGGGAFIGGTGTANKLDDYEEGTWTPTLNASDTGTLSGNAGYYIKIGSMVFINCVGDKSGGSESKIEGLPFTVLDYGANYNNSAINGRKGDSKVITQADDNKLSMLVQSTGLNDNSASFGFSLTYYTDA